MIFFKKKIDFGIWGRYPQNQDVACTSVLMRGTLLFNERKEYEVFKYNNQRINRQI